MGGARAFRLTLAAWSAILLAGCGSGDSASYLIDGSGNFAMTVVRDKDYAWSDNWQVALVMRRNPDCQRRHALRNVADGGFRMEVYRGAEGGFVLHQGKRWYVVDPASCGLQQVDTAPPQPGELVGSFVSRGDPLRFVPEQKQGAASGTAGR